MNKNINYFLSCTFILCSLLCFAQQNKIDSLCQILKNLDASHSLEFNPRIKGSIAEVGFDTTYINTLNALAWELKNNNLDTSFILSTQALNLSLTLHKENELPPLLEKAIDKCLAKSYHQLGVFNWLKQDYSSSLKFYFEALKIKESLNDKKGSAATLGNIGMVYSEQAEFSKALDYYFKALKLADECGDKIGNARFLGSIGLNYDIQGNFSKALDYYFKALKVKEELGDKNSIASTYCSIGIIYNELGDLRKALDYYSKALKITEQLGDKVGIARNQGNIGNVYRDQKNYPQALNCFLKSLEMSQGLGNKGLITVALGNIGTVLGEQANEATLHHNFDESSLLNIKALDYYFKALKIAEESKNKTMIATTLGNIGSLYRVTKKYKEAEEYIKKALVVATQINALNLIEGNQQSLSDLYEQTNQPVKALEHYKKYIAAKDSIFNEENTKKNVRSEMNFEFEKKQAIEKSEQEKQNAITQQEKQKQKIILTLVSCFLLLVAIFASFMFNRWRVTQKQKLIIEKQKEKIVDSITYAQLIQQSILLEESEIQKLLPDSFVYFQPKDIVSGDFYWCSKVNNKVILAAVDCTGHGVPGAFMSMIGNTLLNQIVNEKQISTPSEILKQLNIGITEALHQKKEGALSHDGMDIALCCIDYSTDQIQYAGAQNPLYIVADNEITVINADIYSIGGDKLLLKKKKITKIEYTNHVIPIKKDMSIFLFSDGYTDQFGGRERKKFGTQKFKELLLNNQQWSMQKQKELIIKAHLDWKGSTTQIDDILVIGIKL